MKLLLLSDIHAYADALDRVLDHAAGAYDEVVILGDVIGYGPEPVRVVERVQELPLRAAIQGNHEAMLWRVMEGKRIHAASGVGEALERHAQQLQEPHLEFLRSLDERHVDDGWAAVHGSPRERFAYLLSVPDARKNEPDMPTDIVFIGHTHVPGAFMNDSGGWHVFPVKRGSRTLSVAEHAKAFVNPGSVGPARDGGEGAAYALFDEDTREVHWHRGI